MPEMTSKVTAEDRRTAGAILQRASRVLFGPKGDGSSEWSDFNSVMYWFPTDATEDLTQELDDFDDETEGEFVR